MSALPGVILGFAEYATQGKHLAAAANCAYGQIAVHRFPDGESRLTLPPRLGTVAYLCRSLDHPNEKLVEILLAADAARALGAEHVGLVAPYLCYMRQDTAFHPGEAVSQRTIGRLLAAHFDEVISVDPHLHRVHDFAQAVPAARAVALHATEPMAAFLRERGGAPLLLGPDEESAQWVGAIAAAAGFEHAVASKTRRGDRDVEVQLPDVPLAGRDVVLVDDVASSGGTLAACARACLASGASTVAALVTHALFVGDALQVLRAAGVAGIWSTDSVPHPTNRIPLGALLARALAPPI